MSTTRQTVLDGALDLLRDPDGPSLSLDSAARRAGLSKPGLMYHFPTKAALLRGVVEHCARRWDHALVAALDRLGVGDVATATPAERFRAYVDITLADELDRADLAVYQDILLQKPLARVWSAFIDRWLALPDDMDPTLRGRLLLVRFAADGYWLDRIGNVSPPTPADTVALRTALDALLPVSEETA